MSSKQMYQEVILDHCKKPRNWGTLSEPTHKAEGINPLCGDHILVSMNVVNEKIEDIQYEGESCAICMASGSMMTAKVKGKVCAEALDMTEQFRVLTTEPDGADRGEGLGSLAVFSGIRDLPSRVKCALLPWHTLIAAINSQTEISTEGDKDPVPGSGTTKG
ncbi:MAG: SUF system NifU family Fe-S cluster assembly protein [Betaproteobacteria bacterium]|jgi:nitrogen fixation NifU-like protein|nr:SUF system NifU family Fe-S cluster assembly protein [Betaproteobacteria bacterium]MDC1433526.1 SUF system NifU family Fe-S cluster assembly protein [Burkholderiales bacterium]MBT5671123.1 SUF system NifU family Fe-S cluster assembly protein [Betaproteobacteria bacterium]MBT6185046.1 SUF system NifU family Fe-S cluster assembly protein [Betaproteobacteria bacterium]MBT6529993.1 SUF system NifU family Fe-S cluster assembly protein [Betaproteobacteria bacterium]